MQHKNTHGKTLVRPRAIAQKWVRQELETIIDWALNIATTLTLRNHGDVAAIERVKEFIGRYLLGQPAEVPVRDALRTIGVLISGIYIEDERTAMSVLAPLATMLDMPSELPAMLRVRAVSGDRDARELAGGHSVRGGIGTDATRHTDPLSALIRPRSPEQQWVREQLETVIEWALDIAESLAHRDHADVASIDRVKEFIRSYLVGQRAEVPIRDVLTTVGILISGIYVEDERTAMSVLASLATIPTPLSQLPAVLRVREVAGAHDGDGPDELGEIYDDIQRERGSDSVATTTSKKKTTPWRSRPKTSTTR